MRKAMGLGFLGAILLLGASVLGSGNGDVVIHLNGGDDVAYIGDTNTVEIWMRNDAGLTDMTIGFEFNIGRERTFLPGDYHNGDWTFPDEVVTAFDDIIWQVMLCGYDPTNTLRQYAFSCHAAANRLASHTEYFLAATMLVEIPPGQDELAYGFVIDNVNYNISSGRYLEWEFVEESQAYAPDFHGSSNESVTNASAPARRFHIVNHDRGPCCAGTVGDVNGSGGDPTIGDVVALIDHLFVSNCGLFCTAEADINQSGGEYAVSGPGGDISIGDVSLLIDHLFVNGTPLPTCR